MGSCSGIACVENLSCWASCIDQACIWVFHWKVASVGSRQRQAAGARRRKKKKWRFGREIWQSHRVRRCCHGYCRGCCDRCYVHCCDCCRGCCHGSSDRRGPRPCSSRTGWGGGNVGQGWGRKSAWECRRRMNSSDKPRTAAIASSDSGSALVQRHMTEQGQCFPDSRLLLSVPKWCIDDARWMGRQASCRLRVLSDPEASSPYQSAADTSESKQPYSSQTGNQKRLIGPANPPRDYLEMGSSGFEFELCRRSKIEVGSAFKRNGQSICCQITRY